MKLFFHYCTYGFSNCYILGADSHGSAAIIIDPGTMDDIILNFIEKNNYRLQGVFVTHNHINHVHGIRTLKRIYDVDIYAVNHIIQDHKAIMVKDGDLIEKGPFKIGIISVPGHSPDSAAFRIDHLLFTGDALSAGLIGSTASTYGAAVQMTALRSKIFSLPGDYTVLPGHGPPTTLEVERRYNAGVQIYDQVKKQRPVFKVDF